MSQKGKINPTHSTIYTIAELSTSEIVQKVVCLRFIQAPIRSTMKDSFMNLIGMLQKRCFLIGLSTYSIWT